MFKQSFTINRNFIFTLVFVFSFFPTICLSKDFNKFSKVTFSINNIISETIIGYFEDDTNNPKTAHAKFYLNGDLCDGNVTINNKSSFKMECVSGYSAKGTYFPTSKSINAMGKGRDSKGNEFIFRIHGNGTATFNSFSKSLLNFNAIASTNVTNKVNKIYSPLKNYSNELIISNACSFDGFKYTNFKLDVVSRKYVDEAKRRGLDCDVKIAITKSEQFLADLDNENLCDKATDYLFWPNKKWSAKSSDLKYINEAKRRGLDCGVKENTTIITSKSNTKPTVSSAELKAERNKRLQLERELAEIKNKLKQEKQKINKDNQKPSINVFFELNGPNAKIYGRITDNTEVAEVLIEGEAIGLKNNGIFNTELYVPRNGLDIEIVAYDLKGNKAQKTLRLERKEVTHASGPTFDALNPSAKSVKSNPFALALIIGVADYAKTPANALYADKDAQQFYDYATMKLGIPSSNIKELVNDKADLGEILINVKDWLRRSAKPNKSDIYIYFAGHGLASQDGTKMYLLPYDGRPRLLENTALLRGELFKDIQQANPRSVTVFLDTCYSGVTRNEEMLIAGRPIVIKTKEQAIPDGFTLFSAASNEQISRPLEEAKHGMFSYFLMKGMEGDADANNDNKITARELHAYVEQNVVQQSSGSQTPELQGDKDRVLVQFN